MKITYPNTAIITVPLGMPIPPGYSGVQMNENDISSLAFNVREDAKATEQWLRDLESNFNKE